ncbi:protein-L-isoaspartate O-methyltransferase [Altererythrobacter xixiisoli]|uniref:Protein-L-isoaspartate O-methyltransferase n=2 Tax=Croceibacterium xixiisoli TaxID=1476466 RepID=A0A6I4TSU9_9SPHN|nr:protein-L-isoaspartate O-methyltransferase [Croceibacterium xixiisoli]
MVDSQLRTSGVNAEFVLQRMGVVAREDFVPSIARGIAYIDRAIALDGGRQLAAPVVQGRMLQEAAPNKADRALLVDGGSGYLAELLRPLVQTLDVVSPEQALAADTPTGDYSLVLIDGAVEQLPAALAARIADSGRIVTGLVINRITSVAIGRKSGATISLLPVIEMGIPVLAEFNLPKGWSF